MDRKVLVCQHITCSKQGSPKVLAAFQTNTPPEIAVEPSGCLGQCGSGPMVLILPEETWYCHVHPADVPIIVAQHLQRGQVVSKKLYPKFHPAHQPGGIWLAAVGFSLGLLILLFWILASQSDYL